MHTTDLFAVISWILLLTVMFGGYSLLRLLAKRVAWLTPERKGTFRAGHAHAGVLLAVSLLYYMYLDRVAFDETVKMVVCVVLLLGILAQSGGFFLHLAAKREGRLSAGHMVTILGALLLAVAFVALIYGLIAVHV
ncbi:hypothetical protein [Ktedonospora formicarum]|uniref:Uncharacterized protein n=1 Tax=Ktedonospora formicarum TaxID=2778364 RepID=A0A8J3I7E3_9CHLR|nr:hypothetical protein [Ktedonospora formicarum]GHO48225.1 hypothetical protein KSX_63880 [Ktedonospora formicarum]